MIQVNKNETSGSITVPQTNYSMSAEDSLRYGVFRRMSMTYFGTKVYSEADYVGGFTPGSRHHRIREAKLQD